MARVDAKQKAEDDRIAKAIQNAKAKNDRLKLMKTRNEHYLAENRDEHERDHTEEL
jgi:hypothetical protein